MERQVILLGDLIDVFREELGYVLDAVDSPGRPPVYPAEGMFLSWLLMYLGIADSQRRLIQLLTQHRELRRKLGLNGRIPDQTSFSWFKNHRAKHVLNRFSMKPSINLLKQG